MTKPVLYSKPNCVQCTATARYLDKNNVDYVEVDLTETPDALTYIKTLGYLQAPVVDAGNDVHWSGYRPDQIEEHLL